ncbi:hypothetical protein PsorP6_017058 [Peronosclerospora sorghi]|uniref:Uncharacterized protein n=1 Tax=Peronosclerospora sorghi TaxID=230839 RepID=A0ACC0WC87_9STRA|nr:hypothetical protein PsorP6_017058 [Peronosclerospora sorghi]
MSKGKREEYVIESCRTDGQPSRHAMRQSQFPTCSRPLTTSLFSTRSMTSRATQSAAKKWLGDKGTWPVLVTCAAAATLCTAQCVRYLSGHPDVTWSKQNRQDLFRYKEDTGAHWQSHRRKLATMHKNVINEAKGLNE